METIEQAVVLASPKTIREIVLACQIRQLFAKTAEKSIGQFWRHSIAVGFFAKLFSLPADPQAQTPAQRAEFSRYRLEDNQVRLLHNARLWEKLALEPQEDPFTGGLLHDLGKITMIMCLEECLELISAVIEDEVREQTQQGKLWANSVVEIERFLMVDIDHQVIGYRLAQRWKMGERTRMVIGFHHNLEEKSANLLKLVVLADLAANTLFPYPALETQHPLPRLLKQVDQMAKKKPGKTAAEGVYNAIRGGAAILEDVYGRLGIPPWLWKTIDFKDFFNLCYHLAPKLRATTIGFLQQTGG